MKQTVFLSFILLLAAAPFLAAQSAEKPTGRKFAFLVGVTEYEFPNTFPTLAYTVADVKAWQEMLESIGFQKEDIIVMDSTSSVSRRPTKPKILAAMNELLGKVTRDDIVICMFSGHGTQVGKEQFFCPEDARLEDLADSCVALNEVLGALKRSPAKFKWMIVDACRNDPTRSMSDSGVKAIGKVESVPPGVTAIFSCADTEKSYEDSKLGHGVFTHFLMQGLDGKAADKEGVVTILDLYKYVQKETQGYVVARYNQSQIPYWDGEFTNFILRDDVLIEGVTREKYNEAEAAHKLAQELRLKKEYVSALAEIEKALEILPEKQKYLNEKLMIRQGSSLEKRAKADSYATVAMANFDKSDYKKATAEIDKALKLFPTDSGFQATKKLIESAEKQAKTDANRSTADGYAKAASAYLNKKNYVSAKAEIDKALKLYPTDSGFLATKNAIDEMSKSPVVVVQPPVVPEPEVQYPKTGWSSLGKVGGVQVYRDNVTGREWTVTLGQVASSGWGTPAQAKVSALGFRLPSFSELRVMEAHGGFSYLNINNGFGQYYETSNSNILGGAYRNGFATPQQRKGTGKNWVIGVR